MHIRLVLAALVALTPVVLAQPESFDLVIINGRVIDGTGAPARMAAIGIRGAKIARIGGGVTAGRGAIVIDARGEVVAPGFIDVHTHADDLADRPEAVNFIRMGVTTIVAGNCGSSALDIGAALERITQAGPAVNFATLIGHNTVRSEVMGRAQRSPSPAELQKMKSLVFRGVADGAVGFSTGLQYIPGTYAGAPEIIELAR